MKLIIQPEDGVKPLVEGIENARKSVEIAIFRFDHKEVEHALENAVKRGAFVHALIADTNRKWGEKSPQTGIALAGQRRDRGPHLR